MNNEEIKEKENTAQTANETANAENDTENTSEANTEAFDNKEQAAAEEKTEEKDPLQKAQEELESLKDKYLRTVAEFDNYRKRSLKEKTELVLNGGEKTITAILPVLDDMERAVANADKADSVKALEEGWELIFKKLRTILEGLGVKKIDTDDKEFEQRIAKLLGTESALCLNIYHRQQILVGWSALGHKVVELHLLRYSWTVEVV